MISEPILVALRVVEALEACGARYLVGGSMASSFCGEPRSTVDIDLVVAISRDAVDAFVHALGSEFYADPDSIRDAVAWRSSANVIHAATSIKIDLFMVGGTPLDDEQMARRRRVRIAGDTDLFLYTYAPEDILLQKLRWYRLGNQASDRQWRDVLGIIRVQSTALDAEYLRRGAAILGVSDLLEKALRGDADGGA